MQGTFRYIGQNQSGNVHSKAQYSLNCSLSKDLFGDKASIAFNFINILNSRIEQQTVTGVNYYLESTTQRMGRRATATFTYRFNRKKNEQDRMPGS